MFHCWDLTLYNPTEDNGGAIGAKVVPTQRRLDSVALGKLLNVALRGRQLTCEACQGSFICGPLLGMCWCAKVKLPKETREQLRDQYSNCLCQKCLENAGQSGTKS